MLWFIDNASGEPGDGRLSAPFSSLATFTTLAADNRIRGNGDNDKLDGGKRNGILFDEAGNDELDGSAGNDTLDGASDNHTLTRGLGPDFFQGGRDIDTATDFSPAQGDTKDQTAETF